MPKSPETGFGGVPEQETPSVEKELTEQERLEQETRDHFQQSENCGVAAYAELSGKVPKEKVEEIYRQQGHILEGAVRRGALWFGNLNHQPETPVRNPQEYVQALKGFIEQQKQEAEKAEAATPEYIEEMKKYGYRSSVDGKNYPNTTENWKFHLFSGKKENYEAWAEEARATLEGFGKVAMEAGDAIAAKEALEYSGYLQKFPEFIKVLDEK